MFKFPASEEIKEAVGEVREVIRHVDEFVTNLNQTILKIRRFVDAFEEAVAKSKNTTRDLKVGASDARSDV